MAILPMQDLFLAQRELDRVAEIGLRGVALRPMFYPAFPGPAGAAFPPAPAFAPLWRQLEDLGLIAGIHASPATTNPDATSEGTFIERVSQQMGIGHSVAEAVAFMQDNALFVVSACYHGLMEDYPRLKLALAHGGASMVPLALEKAETYIWLGSSRQTVTADPVSLAPEEVFNEHPVVVQFDSWDTAVADMPDLFSWAAWGSRYPNHDTSTPAEAVELLQSRGVQADIVARLMGRNAIDLFGLEVDAAIA
jgi:predicted TIM-barrel fold metal-dependent hydrolase